MTDDDVTELHNDLMRRAEACDALAMEFSAHHDEPIDAERCSGKAEAYRHAAELLRAAAKGGA